MGQIVVYVFRSAVCLKKAALEIRSRSLKPSAFSKRKENRRKVIWGMIPVWLFLSSCQSREQNRLLTTTPVTLSSTPFLVTVRPSLTTTGYFSQLCIAIPPGYEEDTKRWQLRAPDGNWIALSATLQKESGTLLQLDRARFLLGKKDYMCLAVTPSEQGSTYKQVSLQTTLPLKTDEIRWLSTDKQ